MVIEYIVALVYLSYAIYILFHTKKISYLCIFSFLINLFGHSFGLSFVIVNFFGTTLYAGDILVICMFICLCLKRKKIPKNITSLCIFGLLAFLLFSMGLGVRKYGLTSDFFGDVRKFFYFGVPLLYFYLVGLEVSFRKLSYVMDKVMTALAIYCFVAWGCYAIGLPITNGGDLRVIGSNYTLIIVMYTLYLMYTDLFLSESKNVRCRTILFIVIIIVLQHNSTWLAFAGGLIVMLVLKSPQIITRRQKLVFQIFGLCVFLIVMYFVFYETEIVQAISRTIEKFQDIENETGTFGTRITIWRLLIQTIEGYEWLIGKPFGTGYHVPYRGGTWMVSPHNGYLEGLLRVGLLGMSCLLVNISGLIYKDVTVHKTCLVTMILVALMIYWIPYSFTFEAGILIGIISNKFRERYNQV